MIEKKGCADRGGEVLPALVHERVAPTPCPVADLSGHLELQCFGVGAGGERVELCLQLQLGGDRRRELLAGGALRDPGADLLGKG